jgi:hypothetical protein
MSHKNGAGPATAETVNEARNVDFGVRPSTPDRPYPQVWSLQHGSRTLVRVVPADSSPLYRIEWPDFGLSPPANLSRCMAAVVEWAERQFLTEHRNLGDARRLKSLEFFSWSASPVRQNAPGVVQWPRRAANARRVP